MEKIEDKDCKALGLVKVDKAKLSTRASTIRGFVQTESGLIPGEKGTKVFLSLATGVLYMQFLDKDKKFTTLVFPPSSYDYAVVG